MLLQRIKLTKSSNAYAVLLFALQSEDIKSLSGSSQIYGKISQRFMH